MSRLASFSYALRMIAHIEAGLSAYYAYVIRTIKNVFQTKEKEFDVTKIYIVTTDKTGHNSID